jgi:hypothetical protein
MQAGSTLERHALGFRAGEKRVQQDDVNRFGGHDGQRKALPRSALTEQRKGCHFDFIL